MPSIIFVTLKDGVYADHWSSDLLPVAVSEERAGVRELTWEGQKSGLRDDLAKPGTVVALRPKKDARYFEIVGTILVKQCVRPWTAEKPAAYTLLVEILRTPRRIEWNRDEDTFTHNTVLRAVGLPIECGAMPHGIYA